MAADNPDNPETGQEPDAPCDLRVRGKPGRPKGGKNRSTIERERARVRKAEAEAAARLKSQTIGVRRFTGDSLDFLRSIYQNYKLPLITRLDAAKAALRFERPSLAPVEWLPAGERPVDDTAAERTPKPAQEPVATADAGDEGEHVVDALATARAEDRRQRQLETIARFSGARRAAKAIEAALATSPSSNGNSNGNGGGPGADHAGSSGVH